MTDDVAALQLDLRGDVQRGGVADVVAVRLERRAQHGDPVAEERAAEHLPGELDHPDPAAHVDRVDLAQEGQRLVGAQLAGPGHERADVLGQAAAAEAQPGTEELRADPLVVADRRRPSAVTSAPAASQTSAIALMKEIFVARKAFAAVLTSSAVG